MSQHFRDINRLNEINDSISKLERQLTKLHKKTEIIEPEPRPRTCSPQIKDFSEEDSNSFHQKLSTIISEKLKDNNTNKLFFKKYKRWKQSINEDLKNTNEAAKSMAIVHQSLSVNSLLSEIKWKNENVINSKPMNRRIIFTEDDIRTFLRKFESDPKNFLYISHDFKPCRDVVLFYYTNKKRLNLKGICYGYSNRKMAQLRIGLRTGNFLDRTVKKEKNY